MLIHSITTDILLSFFPLDLEWKLIYVGSAEDETYDQLLESVLVGPINIGNYRFIFQVVLSEYDLKSQIVFRKISESDILIF